MPESPSDLLPAGRPAASIRFPLSWLLALVVLDSSFLLAAQHLEHPTWAAAVLVIAAVANVPLFLTALLMLRGKF
jgi:hypothetical protein